MKHRIATAFLSAALLVGAAAPSASAAPATPVLSAGVVTEGQTFYLNISSGSPFPAGSMVDVLVRADATFGVDARSLGRFALPGGQTYASFPLVIDDAKVNTIERTSMLLDFVPTGGLELDATVRSITVLDNDSATAPPAATPPAGTPPAAAPPAGTPPTTTPTGATPGCGNVAYPRYSRKVTLRGRTLSFKLQVPFVAPDGYVYVTRGGKKLGGRTHRVWEAEGKLHTVKVKLSKSSARKLLRSGGKVRVIFAWNDDCTGQYEGVYLTYRFKR